jgi:hypothetical protein
MTRIKLYSLVLVLSAAGYFWIGYNYNNSKEEGVIVCPFRKVTGVPCPSCGTTEAIVMAAKGNVLGALTINPLVSVASIMVTIFPLWVLFDLTFRKSSFLRFYLWIENKLRVKLFAVIAVSIVLAVWAWNIYRYFK